MTIPEGYTVGDIAIALEKAQIMKASEFLAEAKTFTPYPYMKGTKPTTYPVEGFLFPSTYEVPVGATAKDVIMMMADENESLFNASCKKANSSATHEYS